MSTIIILLFLFAQPTPNATMLMNNVVSLLAVLSSLILLTKIKTPNISLFFFCLGGFCLFSYLNNMEMDNCWFLFLILLPTLGGLFQLFMQMVSYISGQKPFLQGGLGVVSFVKNNWLFLVMLGGFLSLHTLKTNLNLSDSSLASSYNHVIASSIYLSLSEICLLAVISLICCLGVLLKDSSKAMKSTE